MHYSSYESAVTVEVGKNVPITWHKITLLINN